MILIDLCRDIEHKMAVLPNHPQVIVTSVRHPRRGARGGRLRLFIRHDGAGDGRPRRHPRRCAEAFQRRSECHADRPGAAGELLHRGGLPRPVAQAAEVGHFHRRSGEGRAGRRRHHQAEGHRAAAHGLLPPHPRHAGLHHRLSRADQGVGDLARPEGHRHVRRRGGEPGPAGPQQFRGASRLPRSRLHPHGGAGQSRQARRQGPLPLHRLSDQDQGRHRRARSARWRGSMGECYRES